MNTREFGKSSERVASLPAGAVEPALPGHRRSAPSGGTLRQAQGDREQVGSVGASSWPYPFWIAHRGAGKLAPENTLAAFKLGAGHGYRMFECDVKLSADRALFLLHDATLERTTNGHGIAGDQAWGELATLDAGSWHSAAFVNEALPALDVIARYCIDGGYFLNIEIKPTPGQEAATGSAVANAAAKLWPTPAVPPLLTSFAPDALEAAQAAQPQLPRGLLLGNLWTGWLETALSLDCIAVVCHHLLWDASSVMQAKSAGFRCLSYTVNDEASAQRLIDLGMDGLITDRVDIFNPDR